METRIFWLFLAKFISSSLSSNECGTGINLCDVTIRMPWTKCFSNTCSGHREQWTLICCSDLDKTPCYKACNVTDSQLIIKKPCSPRCVNGQRSVDGVCHCSSGYSGQCCDECPPGNHCLNGGQCGMVGSELRCYCRGGYYGNKCQLGPTTTRKQTTRTTTQKPTTLTPLKITWKSTISTTQLKTTQKPATTTKLKMVHKSPSTTTTPRKTTRKPTTSTPPNKSTRKPTTSTPQKKTTRKPTTTTPNKKTTRKPTTTTLQKNTTRKPTTSTPQKKTTRKPTTSTPQKKTTRKPTTSTPQKKTTRKPTTSTPQKKTTRKPTISTPKKKTTRKPTTTTLQKKTTRKPTTNSTPSRKTTPTSKPTTFTTPKKKATLKPTTTTTLQTKTTSEQTTTTTPQKITRKQSTNSTPEITTPKPLTIMITTNSPSHPTIKSKSSTNFSPVFPTTSASIRLSSITQTNASREFETETDVTKPQEISTESVNWNNSQNNFENTWYLSVKIWSAAGITVFVLVLIGVCILLLCPCRKQDLDNKVIPMKDVNSVKQNFLTEKKKREYIRPRFWKY